VKSSEALTAFTPISARDLIRECPDLRPIVTADLLRQSETVNMLVAPTVGKSWLIHSSRRRWWQGWTGARRRLGAAVCC